jgi:RNA polymerase sigma factor (sigma-70 family)
MAHAAVALIEVQEGEFPRLWREKGGDPPKPFDSEESAKEWFLVAEKTARHFLRRMRDNYPWLRWFHDQVYDDCLQEARLRLLEVVSEKWGQMDVENLKRYAAVAVRNRLIELWRQSCRRQMRPRALDTLPPDDVPTARGADEGEMAIDLTDLASALDALQSHKPQMYEAAVLSLRDELPSTDVAERLGVNLRTAQRRIKEAKAWLRTWLERGGVRPCRRQNVCRGDTTSGVIRTRKHTSPSTPAQAPAPALAAGNASPLSLCVSDFTHGKRRSLRFRWPVTSSVRSASQGWATASTESVLPRLLSSPITARRCSAGFPSSPLKGVKSVMSTSATLSSKPKAGEAGLAQKVNAAVEPIVDPEFRDRIPPLSPEELAALEAQLLADGGCRDPLVVWKGHNILLDGHNRLAICKVHGLRYTVVELEFASREEARDWAVKNQLARRNLAPEKASYLRGCLYRAAARQGERTDLTSGHGDHKSTAERIAAEAGLAEKTVRREADFAHDLDVLAENCGAEVRSKVLSRELKLSRTDLRKLAALLPSEQKAAVPKLLAGERPMKKAPTPVAPRAVLARAWAKLKDEHRQEAIKGLLADAEFAATLEKIQQAESARQEAVSEEDD